jgi:hypothetical protein
MEIGVWGSNPSGLLRGPVLYANLQCCSLKGALATLPIWPFGASVRYRRGGGIDLSFVRVGDHPLGVSSSHFHGLRVFVTWTERCCEADLWLPIGFRKCLGDHAFTEIRRFQIAEKPPSTDNSTPFTKLESSEARSRATVAISSGRLIFPAGSGLRTSPSSPRRAAGNPVCRPAPGSARSPGYSCPSVC